MRRLLVYALSFVFLGTYAQFQDDFSDGNFSANPIWFGDVDSFEINASNQLHLNAPANTQESYLVTASQAAVDGYWSFYVDLAFNPSGSNKAYIYLMADQSNLEANLQGYYVLVGNTTDEVSLYRQDGNANTKIIDGLDGTVATTPKVLVNVTRDILGNFELFIDTTANFTNSQSQGTVADNTYTSSSFFGIRCDYTATRSDKFIFDDFECTAQPYVDVFAPKLLSHSITSLQEIKLFFSEPLDISTAENVSNYITNNNPNTPTSAVWNAQDNSVLLSYSLLWQANTVYDLTISHIEDLNANSLDTSFQFQLENAYSYEQLIFNEILADETPSFGLPTYEFIEFLNLSSDTLFTADWYLSDATDTSYFDTDTILPNQYVIVSNTSSQSAFTAYGKAIGLSNFISLNKSEDVLSLYDKYGNVLDSLHYFDDWFAGALAPNGSEKVDGGWSLARANANFPCQAALNWMPSNDTIGGSPGTINNVNQILGSIAPKFVSAHFVNDTTIHIVFNQEIVGGLSLANYSLSYTENGQTIQSPLSIVWGSGRQYYLSTQNPVDINFDYQLSTSNIYNCYGVPMLETSIELVYVKKTELGDIIINEVLFNPYTDAEDYIEIYNTSNYALDLAGISIVEYDINQEDTIVDFSDPLAAPFIIPPKAYFTFSEDTQSVFANYIVDQPKWLFEHNIPNLADKEGVFALVQNDSLVLDKLHYYSRWHFELLDTENGVALERINSQANTQDADNWASAAASFGYGTPTAKNSQAYVEIAQENQVSISPEVFTPNQDGQDDFALIHYTLDQAGFVANVSIYDVLGRKVKDLATKETIGAEGFWKWDGTNQNQEKAKTGIYIIWVQLFDLNAKKLQFKKTITLGTKF